MIDKDGLKFQAEWYGWFLFSLEHSHVRLLQGIQTAYKQEPDTPMHSIKVSGDIDADLFHILCKCRAVETCHTA